MKKYPIRTYNCVLTPERFVQLDYVKMKNSDGCFEMGFFLTSGEFEGKLVKCKFSSYIFFSVLDEFFDVSTEHYENILEGESVHSKFGPVLVYDESPWLGETEKTLLDDESLPNHYVFITADDIVEVVSQDEPVFEIVEREVKLMMLNILKEDGV